MIATHKKSVIPISSYRSPYRQSQGPTGRRQRPRSAPPQKQGLTPHAAERIPMCMPSIPIRPRTRDEEWWVSHLNHAHTMTVCVDSKRNSQSKGGVVGQAMLNRGSAGRTLGFHFTTDFVRRVASRDPPDTTTKQQPSVVVRRPKSSTEQPSEGGEQQLCSCLSEADAAIAAGNPCEAIMWFEAGVAAINKCDARIVQLLGASHELMNKMSKAVTKGQCLQLSATLMDDSRDVLQSSKGLLILEKDRRMRLKKVLAELREMLYKLVFSK